MQTSVGRRETSGGSRSGTAFSRPVRRPVGPWFGGGSYLPAALRCQRVAFNIFLCFFLRMRLRRFLIKDPMSTGTLVDQVVLRHVAPVSQTPAAAPGTSGGGRFSPPGRR